MRRPRQASPDVPASSPEDASFPISEILALKAAEIAALRSENEALRRALQGAGERARGSDAPRRSISSRQTTPSDARQARATPGRAAAAAVPAAASGMEMTAGLTLLPTSLQESRFAASALPRTAKLVAAQSGTPAFRDLTRLAPLGVEDPVDRALYCFGARFLAADGLEEIRRELVRYHEEGGRTKLRDLMAPADLRLLDTRLSEHLGQFLSAEGSPPDPPGSKKEP